MQTQPESARAETLDELFDKTLEGGKELTLWRGYDGTYYAHLADCTGVSSSATTAIQYALARYAESTDAATGPREDV